MPVIERTDDISLRERGFAFAQVSALGTGLVSKAVRTYKQDVINDGEFCSALKHLRIQFNAHGTCRKNQLNVAGFCLLYTVFGNLHAEMI